MDGSFDNAQVMIITASKTVDRLIQTGKFGDAVYLNGSQSIEIGGDENVFDFAGESLHGIEVVWPKRSIRAGSV